MASASSSCEAPPPHQNGASPPPPSSSPPAANVSRIFFVGDVMLGRGVDQILRHHVDPKLYEDYVKDARDYVALAVHENGPLPEERTVEYVWGDALEIFEQMKPSVKIINLETAVTAGGRAWPRKGINYRVHPANMDVLQAAGVDCAVLANNHVLDWDYAGLTDTLEAVRGAGVQTVGAGEDVREAQAPAVFPVRGPGGRRVLVLAVGSPSAGVPAAWRATAEKAGVFYLDSNAGTLKEVSRVCGERKAPGDVVVLSVHWGSNWDFDVEPSQKDFAHRAIDSAGVDLVYGHSSHHIKGVEVYKGKLIVYGAGDFLSDYEGIKNPGVSAFRDDLSFMYFADLKEDGRLAALKLFPMRLKHIQVRRAEGADRDWLFSTMKRECKSRFGTDIEKSPDGSFSLLWKNPS